METVECISHIYLKSNDSETDFYAPGVMTKHKLLQNSFLWDFYRELPVGARIYAKYRCFRLTISETGDVCKVRKAGKGTFSLVKTQEK